MTKHCNSKLPLHESKVQVNEVMCLLHRFLPGSGVQNHPEYGLNIRKHKEDRQLFRDT